MPSFLAPIVQPLFESAVEQNALGKAKLALMLGADPNASLSQPLLCRAAAAGQLELVKALVKGGAKVTAKDAEGDTPLLCALRGTDISVAQAPKAGAKGAKGGKPSASGLEGKATSKAKAWTPGAANSSKRAAADKTTTWVLDDGGNIADKGARSERKLSASAAAIVEVLLKAGSNVNVSSTGGMTYRLSPLMLAAQWGNPSIVRMLLKAGAHVNAHDSDGETVLMYGSAEGVADVVQALIKAGANLDAQNAAGDTALHAAAQYNRAAAVTMLLTAGANLNIRSHKGLSAIDSAISMRSTAAAKAIVAFTGVNVPGANPPPPEAQQQPPSGRQG